MYYIKSPINYTGNKYRLLVQYKKYFPQKIGTFVDLFCGGATVGINVDANRIIMIDSNPRVIRLLKYLAKEKIAKLIATIEALIKKYNLSYSAKYTYKFYRDKGYVEGNNGLKKYNDEGYYKLRDDYNSLSNKKTNIANAMLYVLMVYAFNNDIRFNKSGNFNLPVGKTDFNNNNMKKLLDYNKRVKDINIEFVCADFRSSRAKKYIEEADFLYADPPYLITTAVYNEANGWNETLETSLIELLDDLNKKGKKFALSNVLRKKGKNNEILADWIDRTNGVIAKPINYHYRSASYNKINRDSNEMEVLVVNG